MTDFSKSAPFAAAILTLTLPVSSDVVLAQSPQPQQRSAPQAQPVQPAAKARPKAAAPATPADPATPQRQTSAQGGEVVARVGG
ncbi:hypothetical protein K8353_44075, partial [Burkholderia contaminans]|nr:hypothetical protein [Burkholderia contaminans]